jgi:hypothetical protein
MHLFEELKDKNKKDGDKIFGYMLMLYLVKAVSRRLRVGQSTLK